MLIFSLLFGCDPSHTPTVNSTNATLLSMNYTKSSLNFTRDPTSFAQQLKKRDTLTTISMDLYNCNSTEISKITPLLEEIVDDFMAVQFKLSSRGRDPIFVKAFGPRVRIYPVLALLDILKEQQFEFVCNCDYELLKFDHTLLGTICPTTSTIDQIIGAWYDAAMLFELNQDIKKADKCGTIEYFKLNGENSSKKYFEKRLTNQLNDPNFHILKSEQK
eukprot:NODE_678_length_4811_cov_0.248302.p3 type:complete len:218 gc:universal NODE_678_length_4811_cov_0.248302:2589-1936(-)